MKALSMLQPWAMLVALGLKCFETRSWDTKYRGPLAIHASKGANDVCREAFEIPEIKNALVSYGYKEFDQLPRGSVIGIVLLVRTWHTQELVGAPLPGYGQIGRYEYMYGNWTSGRFAWNFLRPRLVEPVIPARGSLGIWEWACDESVMQRYRMLV